MTTLLVIDIGNTNVSLGVFDYEDPGGTGDLSQHWRIGTHREQTSDEVSLAINALFQQARRNAVRLRDESRQQVDGIHLLVPPAQRLGLCPGQRLLCLVRELVRIHRPVPFHDEGRLNGPPLVHHI